MLYQGHSTRPPPRHSALLSIRCVVTKGFSSMVSTCVWEGVGRLGVTTNYRVFYESSFYIYSIKISLILRSAYCPPLLPLFSHPPLLLSLFYRVLLFTSYLPFHILSSCISLCSTVFSCSLFIYCTKSLSITFYHHHASPLPLPRPTSEESQFSPSSYPFLGYTLP